MSSVLDILKIILFGIIEGVTEWLPISSTGHMIILEDMLGAKEIFEGGKAFWDFFLVAIQLGAILAVIVCFFNKLNPFFGKSLKNPKVEKSYEEKKEIWILWAKVLVACLPAAIIGLFLDDWLDQVFYNSITVSITLILYGVLFIVMELWNKKRKFKITDVKQLSFKTAFIIGLMQLLALIPGTSRSGVTILGAMLILCNREVACEFSFFLSIPVMFGASLLKGAKYVLSGALFNTDDFALLLIGSIVAFAVSMFVIKFLMSFIKRHDFKAFGVYRIVLGILLLILFLCGFISI
ncbi:MAG: undecaprenyl-diphosphate phosphatase [Anaeroplasmataceae bacterium]|nr:undecaprenyl-diphosphate phosphatase [Anaeroplasmataceae bacterium]MDE5868247.1 undecaprenyl-diphosphate phosphatase [Anaeroplasmataceae bacterium]